MYDSRMPHYRRRAIEATFAERASHQVRVRRRGPHDRARAHRRPHEHSHE